MKTEAINQYLDKLEQQLLHKQEEITVELNRAWANKFANKPAVCIFKKGNNIVYVGESVSLRRRMNDLVKTPMHSFRRNLAKELFANHPEFKELNFDENLPEEVERLLNKAITRDLKLSFLLVELGRTELKERIISKWQPEFNLQGKRNPEKTYTKAGKQQEHKNAYERWSTEDDEKLELLFCEGKP